MTAHPPGSLTRQDALREVRERYTNGALTFEEFKEAFDEITRAETPTAWQDVIQHLPVPSALHDLEVIDHSSNAALAHPQPDDTRSIVAIIGEVERTRRPWRFGSATNVTVLVGEAKLDLSLAELPAHGTMHVFVAIGAVHILIPQSVSVSIHGVACVGEIDALGEKHSGIPAICTDEAKGTPGGPHLDIHIVTLVGEATIHRCK
jgi:Cell wall-active antibiotics response 4TMS YvqF